MFEQAARIVLAERQQPARALALGDVLDGDQHALPRRLATRQQLAAELDVDPASGQRVVDAMADEATLAIPELHEFVDQVDEHFIAKDPVEVGDQMGLIRGFEQRERPGVDLDDPDTADAGGDAGLVFGEMGAQVRDAGASPLVEQRLDAAVVLEPERNRRRLEHAGVVDGTAGGED